MSTGLCSCTLSDQWSDGNFSWKHQQVESAVDICLMKSRRYTSMKMLNSSSSCWEVLFKKQISWKRNSLRQTIVERTGFWVDILCIRPKALGHVILRSVVKKFNNRHFSENFFHKSLDYVWWTIQLKEYLCALALMPLKKSQLRFQFISKLFCGTKVWVLSKLKTKIFFTCLSTLLEEVNKI